MVKYYEEAKELIRGIAPGPWTAPCLTPEALIRETYVYSQQSPEWVIVCKAMSHADAKFIAGARTLIPGLIELCERYELDINKLRGANSIPKYKFTGETKEQDGSTLHRIRAVRDFGHVKAGDLGGWIETECNLSHDGNAWVSNEAVVRNNAQVIGNASVGGFAQIGEGVSVSDDAAVIGRAVVSGRTSIYGLALVDEQALISGDVIVGGCAVVCGFARVTGNVQILGHACINASALICNNKDYFTIGPIGSRGETTTFFLTQSNEIYVTCGCFLGDIQKFSIKVEEIHGDNYHGKAYKAAIELAKTCIKLQPNEECEANND